MPALGLELTRLRATVDTASLAEQQVRLHVEGGLLRLSQAGLAQLLPPGVPLSVRGISQGRILLNGKYEVMGIAVGADAEIAAGATSQGRLLLEVVSVRGAGFLTVPRSLVIWGIRNKLPNRPGIRIDEADRLEIDPAAILHPMGVTLPPLKAVRADGGVLEVEF
jgi:hypothetical protein